MRSLSDRGSVTEAREKKMPAAMMKCQLDATVDDCCCLAQDYPRVNAEQLEALIVGYDDTRLS